MHSGDNSINDRLEAGSSNEWCDDMHEEGPTEADVSSLRSIEQRSWENMQQENTYWQEMLASTYMSRSYQMASPLSDVPLSPTSLTGADSNQNADLSLRCKLIL